MKFSTFVTFASLYAMACEAAPVPEELVEKRGLFDWIFGHSSTAPATATAPANYNSTNASNTSAAIFASAATTFDVATPTTTKDQAAFALPNNAHSYIPIHNKNATLEERGLFGFNWTKREAESEELDKRGLFGFNWTKREIESEELDKRGLFGFNWTKREIESEELDKRGLFGFNWTKSE